MAEKTILDLYRRDVDSPRPDHYGHFTPDGSRSLSTEDFFHATSALAQGLAELGIEHGDRVMLLSENRSEWHWVDLAVLDLSDAVALAVVAGDPAGLPQGRPRGAIS